MATYTVCDMCPTDKRSKAFAKVSVRAREQNGNVVWNAATLDVCSSHVERAVAHWMAELTGRASAELLQGLQPGKSHTIGKVQGITVVFLDTLTPQA